MDLKVIIDQDIGEGLFLDLTIKPSEGVGMMVIRDGAEIVGFASDEHPLVFNDRFIGSEEERKEYAVDTLDKVEKALQALKDKVLPVNPEKYELMSKSYLDYIDKLRKEIG